MPQQVENPAQQKTPYTLPCSILSSPNAKLESSTESWPKRLNLTLIPRQLLQTLFPVLKHQSYILTLQFGNPESEPYQKLARAIVFNSNVRSAPGQPISGNFCGCIQLTSRDANSNPSTPMRVMIVVYLPDKKSFLGFIPMDQDAFYSKLRQIIEQYKKDQKQKQNIPPGPHVYSQVRLNIF